MAKGSSDGVALCEGLTTTTTDPSVPALVSPSLKADLDLGKEHGGRTISRSSSVKSQLGANEAVEPGVDLESVHLGSATGEIIEVYLNDDYPTNTDTQLLLPVRYRSGSVPLGVEGRYINFMGHMTHQDQSVLFSKRGASTAVALRDQSIRLPRVESPLERTIDDLRAVSEILYAEEQERGESTAGLFDKNGLGSLGLLSTTCHEWLQQIAQHNKTIEPKQLTFEVLSHPTITDLWIRERLQEKWQEKYRPALTSRLASIKTQSPGDDAHLMQDGTGTNDNNNDNNNNVNRSREKRRVTGMLLQECMREQLSDVQKGLHRTMLEPLQGLERLYQLHQTQQYLLLREHFTLSELMLSLDERQRKTVRAASTQLLSLDVKLQALSDLMDVAISTCYGLETHLHRLLLLFSSTTTTTTTTMTAAKDVPALSDHRLDQSKALFDLPRPEQDLSFIRENARGCLTALQDVEREFAALVQSQMDTYLATEGCLYFVSERIAD